MITEPERGALFLDEHEPGWYHKIDLTRLNLAHGSLCICGQVYADRCGSTETGFLYFTHKFPEVDIIRHGFVEDDEFDAEWRRIISERQTQTNPQEVTR